MPFFAEVSRCIIYICNSFLAINGITLFIVGCILRRNELNFTIVVKKYLSVGSWAMCLAIGIILSVAFGSYATFKKSKGLLVVYAAFLLGLFVVQVSLGLFASITVYSHEEFEDKVQKQLNTTFKSNNTDFLKHLHKFQIHVINLRHTIYQKFKSDFKFRCCGIEGPQDYKGLPASCCEKQKEPCIYPYIVGCIKPITLECENEIKTIGYVSLVFAINEIFGAWLALALRKRVQRLEETPEDPPD
ncbi:hypothetical protein MTP99_016905 [Tenebrio molitor]|nr:hypothetical protein MTP99_016905 [Tenebrio molitor]